MANIRNFRPFFVFQILFEVILGRYSHKILCLAPDIFLLSNGCRMPLDYRISRALALPHHKIEAAKKSKQTVDFLFTFINVS